MSENTGAASPSKAPAAKFGGKGINIAIGIAEFIVYYLVFRVLITKLNLKTVGREDDGDEVKLHSKTEYKAKVAGEGAAAGEISAASSESGVNAALIVEALGGAENIQKVDNCYTRLRLILKDTDKVQEETLKSDTGAVAVIKKGENVQVVYGPQVRQVRAAVDEHLGLDDEE